MQGHGCQFKPNARNTNIKPDASRNTTLKRPYSRQSAIATTNVDFEIVGSTECYSNLLASQQVNIKNTDAMTFVTTLRSYKPTGKFQASEVFMHPAPRAHFDSAGANKNAFPDPPKLFGKLNLAARRCPKDVKYLRNDPGSRYPERYTEPNMRALREIVDKQTQVPTLVWATNLRGSYKTNK